jgi:hypothetical protein
MNGAVNLKLSWLSENASRITGSMSRRITPNVNFDEGT